MLTTGTLSSRLVAVGASTGGTEAMARLFKLLPHPFPGIVVVQHLPPSFTGLYAKRLDKDLAFNVQEAADNVRIMPNSIYIAPGNRHLLVERRGGLCYTRLGDSDRVNGHCPSVDVLFNSVANELGRHAIGIILTGMGADGAMGLLHMRNRGSYTIGQD
ncbi:MAG: chemotaxis protein CheB, partial [Oscillospiraceae bacterium]|nr:chemotaxis protein CheB [Oscillospiraceae bacterium]